MPRWGKPERRAGFHTAHRGFPGHEVRSAGGDSLLGTSQAQGLIGAGADALAATHTGGQKSPARQSSRRPQGMRGSRFSLMQAV